MQPSALPTLSDFAEIIRVDYAVALVEKRSGIVIETGPVMARFFSRHVEGRRREAMIEMDPGDCLTAFQIRSFCTILAIPSTAFGISAGVPS